MNVTGRDKNESDKKDGVKKDGAEQGAAASKPASTTPRPDEAAETRIDMVSQYAHPRGVRRTNNSRFSLRRFVTKHPIPVALSCLALGGTLAAIILKRRRSDTWEARLERLRKTFVGAAKGAG